MPERPVDKKKNQGDGEEEGKNLEREGTFNQRQQLVQISQGEENIIVIIDYYYYFYLEG